MVGAKLKPTYLSVVDKAYPFLQTTKSSLNRAIEGVIQLYARIATEGKLIVASSDLKNHLRERVVWERNSIWMDMVGEERRKQNIAFRPTNRMQLNADKWVPINLFGCNIYVPQVIPANIFTLLFALAVLISLCNWKIFNTPEQNNCFAILIFASILWSFEVTFFNA